jgi:crossover junction endodeoxyribonuclease RuvC
VRVLGIDPGSVVTGWGVIDTDGHRQQHVAHGCLRVGRGDMVERLGAIFTGLREVAETHQPDVVAIETVFVKENISSALKLGQARGAAICALATQGLAISEYAPTRIKQAVVGRGQADKSQVAHMVRVLLNLPETPASDAADALAVAICHGHSQHSALYDVASKPRGRRR